MVDCTPIKQGVVLEPQTSLDDSTTTTVTTTCEVCRGIWTCLLDSETRLQVTLGYSDRPVSRGCPEHLPLVARFLEASNLYGLEETKGSLSSDEEDTSDTGHIHVAERDAEAAGTHRVPRANELFLWRRRTPNTAELMKSNSMGFGVFVQPLALLKKTLFSTTLELDSSWIPIGSIFSSRGVGKKSAWRNTAQGATIRSKSHP